MLRFARENAFHCGHISFVPQADANGDLKCQTSESADPSELFDDDDIAVYNRRAEQMGFTAEVPYHICDCSTDTRFCDPTFVTAWSGLLKVSPVPATWICPWAPPHCTLCGRDDSH